MPRYYCDYCDTYLTHDSPSVRKQHNAGYKHKGNVRTYYQQFEAQLNQSLIDQKVKEHLGAFRPVGLPFNQLRPGLPGLPPPQMSIAGNPQMPAGWVPGMRPPVLPRPMSGVPGYAPMPQPQMLAPPGAQMPGQVNNMQRPVGVPSVIPVPGSMGMPASTGGPPMFAPPGPPGYQGGTSAPTNGPPGYQGGTTAPTSGPPGYQGGTTAPTNGPPGYQGATTAPTNGPPGYQGGTTAPTSGGGDSSSINAQAPDSKQ